VSEQSIFQHYEDYICLHHQQRVTNLCIVAVTPLSLSRLLVILCQDFLGNFGVQGWFAIALPFYLLIFNILIFFRLIFYQYMVVFQFNTVIYVFLL